MNSAITEARLKSLISYDPTTGVALWIKSNSNRAGVGSIAGTVSPAGYRKVFIDGKRYQLSRLAWLYIYGKWPDGVVDHIDGNPLNNAISNLRDVTRSENQHNQKKAQKHNKLGVLGVHVGPRGIFYADITVNGKVVHLGGYKTAEAAHSAYISAKRKFHTGGML